MWHNRAALSLFAGISTLFAQNAAAPASPPYQLPPSRKAIADHRVEMRNTHERIIAVVPMIGAGTLQDPRRPQFAPPPRSGRVAPSPNGITAYSYQLTDDGKRAIVEFVALNRTAFRAIMADNSGNVKFFEKGKVSRSQLLTELQKHKKDVNLDHLGARIP